MLDVIEIEICVFWSTFFLRINKIFQIKLIAFIKNEYETFLLTIKS